MAVEALKENGADILGMAAIFTYEFQIAQDNFAKANIELTTLSNYSNLLENAVKSNYISKEELDTLQQWRINPSQWNQ